MRFIYAISNVLNLKTISVLEFYSKQKFFIYEKNERNLNTKRLIENIKVTYFFTATDHLHHVECVALLTVK